MKIRNKIVCLLFTIIFVFAGCSQNNDVVISHETKEFAKETIETVNNGNNVETSEIPKNEIISENKIEDEALTEEDGVVEQENISYDGANSGKELSLLGKCSGLTYFSQADSRWGSIMYSNHGDKSQTIKSGGCGATSAAIIVSSSKGAIIPPTMAKLFVDNGYRTYSNGTAWSAWSFVADFFDFKEYHSTSSFSTVEKYLETDKNKDGVSDYFVVVSCGSGLFTSGGHYITIMGDKNNTLTVYDPYLYFGKFNTASRKAANVKLSGTTAYVTETAFKKYANAKNYWVFSNDYVKSGNTTTTKKAATTTTTKKATTETKTMYVTANSSLYIRSGAGKSYDIVGSLSKGSKVSVYEIKNGWARIGTKKWVSTDYLSATKPQSNTVTYKTTVGKNYRLKTKSTLYSKSNLTGTQYSYYAKTEVKILSHNSTSVDYVQVIKTGRKAYIKVANLNI